MGEELVAMAVVVPSTSYGAAVNVPSRLNVKVKKGLRCGFLVGERATFAAGEVKWPSSSSSSAKRKRRNRACVCMAADYYSTLGIAKNATKSEIKAAYRKLARKVRAFFKFCTYSNPIFANPEIRCQ